MKTVVSTLCLAFLLGALSIPAFARGDGAPAAAAILDPAASSEPNPVHAVAQPDGDQLLRFEHISTEQGLSNLDVWSLLRDNQGFMWFATLDGLNDSFLRQCP